MIFARNCHICNLLNCPLLYLTGERLTVKLLHGLMIQTYKYVLILKSAPTYSGVTFLFFYAHFSYDSWINGLRYDLSRLNFWTIM